MTTDTQPAARHRQQPQGLWLDTLGGFLVPVFCVCLDKLLVESLPFHGLGDSIFGDHTLFARGFIGIELSVFLAWVVGRHRLGPLTPFVSGALAVGSAFALAVGLVLLPISYLGAGLVLASVPFFTAFVFARNAARACRSARASCGTPLLVAGMLIGAVLAAGVPAAGVARARSVVERAIEDARAGADPGPATPELRILARSARVELAPIVEAYAQARGGPYGARLARLYEGLTGRDPAIVMALRDD